MKKLLALVLVLPIIMSCGDGDPMSSLEGKKTISLVSDAPSCTTGGNIISLGVDDNKDDELQPEEVDHTLVICNGHVGETGPQGEQGVQGLTGLKGDKGDTGLTGEQGIQGIKGDKGDTGQQGVQGEQGIQGEKGDKGETGAQGIQGEQGVQGQQGIQGEKGDKGDAGQNGANGLDGKDGANGINGTDGTNGTNGRDGVNGSNGHNAAFSVEPVYPSDACYMGGNKLSYGTDMNDNGILEATEATGSIFVCSPSCGQYQCGGQCGACGSGYSCLQGVCSDVDECAAETPVCDANAACSNASGSYSCTCREGYEGDGKVCTFIPQCSATLCGEACVDVQTDKNNCGGCGVSCSANQACAAGICVGSGQLRFTSTWSRNGDIDVWVGTPSGKAIGWTNQGANANTDMGKQDRDDTSGTGPENIYWETTPPTGTYHVCVATNYISPNAANPVTVRVEVARPLAQNVVEERTYTTSVGFGGQCNPSNPTYMFSVVVE
jgi:hypothetical protein